MSHQYLLELIPVLILLVHRMPPDRGLADRKLSGVKAKKTRLTYAFTCNADGTDKLPPFVIGKFKKPRPFKGKTGAESGFDYHNNAKAWMTAILYTHWIEKWDADLTAKGRKVLLLQDNFSGHIVPEGLRSIRVENFEPNLTPHVQPDDQGIICTFKARERERGRDSLIIVACRPCAAEVATSTSLRYGGPSMCTNTV